MVITPKLLLIDFGSLHFVEAKIVGPSI